MSTSTAGCAKRSFIIGKRECPPAMSFAPSSFWASAATASTKVRGRTYSKAAGIIGSPLRLGCADRAPHLGRGQGHVDMRDAKGAKCVADRTDDDRRRGHTSG